MSASKKIAFACDHRGFEVKAEVLQWLSKNGWQVVDCGTNSADSSDYPDFMFPAAEKVSSGECSRAIGICYTGIGSAIAANKVKGVRAALVHLVEEAELCRAHNDSNMLILGAGFMEHSTIIPVIDTWLKTPFEGGRHEQRVNKIKQYEQQHAR